MSHPELSEAESKDLGDNSSGFTPGIRPMEPLQPSNYRKKSATGKKKAPASRHPDPEMRSMTGEGSSQSSSKLATLEKQMKEAAARLDFEEAARIRDIIRSMNV